jgi:mono/diheme cytochrome c family protein
MGFQRAGNRMGYDRAATTRQASTWFWIATLSGALLSVTLAAPANAAGPDKPDQTLIARGEYLSDLGDCSSCHTSSNGRKFAGGRYMPTPFGPISTPNITPDKATGIGNWTDDDFYRVLHEGVGRNGEHIYPVMPYPWYTKVTRDDVLAIKAYLFSLPPVDAPRKPNKLAFPFNIRAGLAVWDEMFLREGTFKPDPTKSAEINRGAYIVDGLGHCGECHNGRNLLGDTKMADQLQGGPIEHWYAPNITSDVRDGIGKYSNDQLFSFLKTGVAPGLGVAAGPMAETIHDSLRKLDDSDLHAIVAYLKSTPSASSYVSAERTAFTGSLPLDAESYLNHCAFCHQLNGEGVKGAVPALAGNGAVLAKGPDDVIRVILGGIEAQGTYAPMPAVGVTMTDQEIADVTNYVRQSWGNEAPPNADAGDVGNLRPTTFTAMNIGPDGHCPTVVQPELAPVINDPRSGITDALRSMTLGTVLQTAQKVLATIKSAAPKAKQSDIVNSLTIAYCPIVEKDGNIPANMKISVLDQFGERVYSELVTHGKE